MFLKEVADWFSLSLCKAIPALPPVPCFCCGHIHRFYIGAAVAQSPAMVCFVVYF